MSAPKDVFVHPAGICEAEAVGPGTRVWAFAHVLPGAVIGREANICDHVFIEGGATLGDRVTVKCHVALWEGVTVGDDVFIGPSAVFANDRYPRSKRYVPAVSTVLENGCSIGAGAVLAPGVRIGAFAMVGAGAVVTKDVAPFALVVGNPARPVGLVCRCGGKLLPAKEGLRCSQGDWTGDAPHAGMACSAALD
ncbi:acyltransferase [Solidesulfovibrio sp.]|uniref:acyltransferase n=1 Tax=Solidesulfovibrio sp. TaxID=2910990 RepID=UPI00260C34AB|nr:acyltransferase [Solidesulfovibrio sp.]